MRQLDPSAFFAYAVALVSLGFGVALLTGWWDPGIPASARYMFGFVMVLLSVYRFLVTRMKARRPRTSYRNRFDE